MLNKIVAYEKKTFFYILLLALLGLLAYSNTLHVPFVFDDEPTIIRNPVIRSLSNLIVDPPEGRYNTGRFIAYLTFAINYRVNGLDVAGYHIFNIAVHIINTLLVYALIILTFKTSRMKSSGSAGLAGEIAFMVSAFFALHPVQTQAVTYIVQRMTSLAALFYLSAVVLYIKTRLSQEGREFFSRRTISFYALSIACIILAMKTKEISFTLPLTIVLYEFLFFRATGMKRLQLILPVLLTALIIPLGIINFNAPLGNVFSDVNEIASGKAKISSADYLLTQFSVIVKYLRLLFFPVNQNLDYDYPLYNSFFDVNVILPFLVIVLLFSSALFMARKAFRGAAPYMLLVSFGIFWFLITISIESSIIPIADIIVEHRIYLPSVGFFTALVAFLMSIGFNANTGLSKAGHVIVSILLIVLILFSFLTFSRNSVWGNETVFWADVVKKSPNLARAHGNLGNAYVKAGKLEDAVREFEMAVDLRPDYAIAHYNLGNIYGKSGDFRSAIEELKIAISIDPKYASPHNNLGLIYKIEGKTEEAIDEYKRALEIEPDNSEIHFNLGVVYSDIGMFDEAIVRYKNAIKLNADYTAAHNNLGAIFGKLGKFEDAIREFQTVKELDPSDAGAYYNLGLIYRKQGRMDEALKEFQAADALRAK